MKKAAILTCCFYFVSYALFASAINSENDSIKSKPGLLAKYIAIETAYYGTAMFVLNQTWYKDREKVPFHFYNDNKAYLQVDKFGHFFGSYFESYIGYHSLRRTSVSREMALIFGGTLGFVLQTPIEIMDGIHEGWGFSWGDMAANALGAGFVIGQEIIFREQLIKYKFSYWETPYARNANGYLGTNSFNRILDDYNGHTYWFSMPLNRVSSWKSLPDWLNVAVGYGANGMYGEFENITSFNGVAIPFTERYRQYLISLDIDWTKIETRSPFVKTLLKGMTFVKLPFPALEYNSKRKFRAYWMYY